MRAFINILQFDRGSHGCQQPAARFVYDFVTERIGQQQDLAPEVGRPGRSHLEKIDRAWSADHGR
jgi:hypothetical protein